MRMANNNRPKPVVGPGDPRLYIHICNILYIYIQLYIYVFFVYLYSYTHIYIYAKVTRRGTGVCASELSDTTESGMNGRGHLAFSPQGGEF